MDFFTHSSSTTGYGVGTEVTDETRVNLRERLLRLQAYALPDAKNGRPILVR